MSDAPTRYGPIAILLHWLIALLITVAILIGWNMTDLPLSPRKLQLYALHKSLGLSVLAAALLRLLWRWRHPAPPLLDTVPSWQRKTALSTHRVLYLLIFLLPISGWVLNSVFGVPLSWFGVVSLPPLAPAAAPWRGAADNVHVWLGWVLITVVAVHAAAALYHHFFVKDGTLLRMLPLFRKRAVPPAALVVILMTGVTSAMGGGLMGDNGFS